MKKLCILIALALVLATSSAYATLVFQDDFNGSGAIANGWALNQTNGSAPTQAGGVATWTMGTSNQEIGLSQSFNTVSGGVVNAYIRMAIDTDASGHAETGWGGNLGNFRLWDGGKWAVLRMASDWNGVNWVDTVAAAPTYGVGLKNPANGMVDYWVSLDLGAGTFSAYVKENGAWVNKVSNLGAYNGPVNNLNRIEWVMWDYDYAGRAFEGWDYARTSIDYIQIYHNETQPVPEPSSFMALGMFGLGALGFIKRRRA